MTKISDFISAGTAADADFMPISQSGNTRKMTLSTLKTYYTKEVGDRVTSLEGKVQYKTQIGLTGLNITDSNFSTTDFAANIATLFNALTAYTHYTNFTSSTNFAASISAKLLSDLGLSFTSGAGFLIEMEVNASNTIPNKIFIYPNGSQRIFYISYDNTVSVAKEIASGDDRRLLTYTAASQLGIVSTSTIADLINAMPSDSMFIGNVSDSDLAGIAAQCPVSYGQLEIIKKTASRTRVMFTANNNGSTTYINKLYWCNFNTTLNEISNWVQIADGTDTGWITATLLNGVTHYDASSGSILKYRKIGNRVSIIGTLGNITSLATVAANIPSGYRPAVSFPFVMAGSGNRFNRWMVSSNGDIRFDNTSYTGTLSSADWYPVATSFIID